MNQQHLLMPAEEAAPVIADAERGRVVAPDDAVRQSLELLEPPSAIRAVAVGRGLPLGSDSGARASRARVWPGASVAPAAQGAAWPAQAWRGREADNAVKGHSSLVHGGDLAADVSMVLAAADEMAARSSDRPRHVRHLRGP